MAKPKPIKQEAPMQEPEERMVYVGGRIRASVHRRVKAALAAQDKTFEKVIEETFDEFDRKYGTPWINNSNPVSH